MFFVGEHHLTIDNKNRLSIPQAVRARLDATIDGNSFYVGPGRRKGFLMLYPHLYFENARRKAPAPDDLSDQAYELAQFEYSQTVLVDPDGQGRVLIPDWLLKRAGIGREVTLIGVRDHLELWNRSDFEAFQARGWATYTESLGQVRDELRGARDGGGHGGSQVSC